LSVFETYSNYYRNSFDFFLKYNEAILEATSESYKSFHDSKLKPDQIKEIRNIMTTKFHSVLGERLCTEDISSSLSRMVDSWLNVVKTSGSDRYYTNYRNYLSACSRLFEPIRDTMNRTPSDVIKIKGDFDLHHYKPIDGKKTQNAIACSLLPD